MTVSLGLDLSSDRDWTAGIGVRLAAIHITRLDTYWNDVASALIRNAVTAPAWLGLSPPWEDANGLLLFRRFGVIRGDGDGRWWSAFERELARRGWSFPVEPLETLRKG